MELCDTTPLFLCLLIRIGIPVLCIGIGTLLYKRWRKEFDELPPAGNNHDDDGKGT